jgi:DNA-binding MarR family transcriptional regulator
VIDLKVLFSELVRFETELWDAVDARLRAECDLRMGWFDLMRAIERRSGCRVQDIAAELAITVGGTSKLVDRIEASGYCRRRSNPDDRRSSIVELTPAGRRLLDAAVAAVDDELAIRLGSVVSELSLVQFAATIGMLRSAGRSPGTSQGSGSGSDPRQGLVG